jgi:hypothetical protein
MSTVRAVEFSRVASTSEIPPGIMRKVTVNGQYVVLANVDGNTLLSEMSALIRRDPSTRDSP